MTEARKKFVRYAMVSVFVMLLTILGIINIISFTMASEDADQLTRMLADSRGAFPMDRREERRLNFRDGRPDQAGPMGLDAPDMSASMRYFTFAFDAEGAAEKIAFSISAVTEEDAESWARSLLTENRTGWTARTYRYRVYQAGDRTFVTVIDQGRELTGPYRILMVSLIGLAAGLLLSYLALMYIGKKMFRPLEEADRKQKNFITEAEREFRSPLTVINANTEMIERRHGESEETRTINRQVKKMIGLVRGLGSAGVFREKDLTRLTFDLSSMVRAAGDAAESGFAEREIKLTVQTDEAAVMTGDSESMSSLVSELLENARKFSLTHAEISVAGENGRITLTAANDTNLPDGPADQAFDRFTRLENAGNQPGVGLGLSYVKEIVQAHNGRVSARVEKGIFTLRVNLQARR